MCNYKYIFAFLLIWLEFIDGVMKDNGASVIKKPFAIIHHHKDIPGFGEGTFLDFLLQIFYFVLTPGVSHFLFFHRYQCFLGEDLALVDVKFLVLELIY